MFSRKSISLSILTGSTILSDGGGSAAAAADGGGGGPVKDHTSHFLPKPPLPEPLEQKTNYDNDKNSHNKKKKTSNETEKLFVTG